MKKTPFAVLATPLTEPPKPITAANSAITRNTSDQRSVGMARCTDG